jgi:hypothetical protein
MMQKIFFFEQIKMNDAKNIRWHANERKHVGCLPNPVDSLQWKKIDDLYSDFGK